LGGGVSPWLDNLAHAALERALKEVEEPHYNNGELVGTHRKFDERLTVALLAMRNRYGVPQMGRYTAAAEYHSERWDALFARVETGDPLWRFEQVRDPLMEMQALEEKHAAEEPPAAAQKGFR
jgi:hypothetical protein